MICVAPDVGGTARARALGKMLNVGLAIVDKRRPAPGKSVVMNVIGNVKNKTCIIVDDIIDSGGTIVNAAKILKQRGARDVHVYVSHGVLSGDAVEKIRRSQIKNLVITDTIDNSHKVKKAKNIEIFTVRGLVWNRRTIDKTPRNRKNIHASIIEIEPNASGLFKVLFTSLSIL